MGCGVTVTVGAELGVMTGVAEGTVVVIGVGFTVAVGTGVELLHSASFCHGLASPEFSAGSSPIVHHFA